MRRVFFFLCTVLTAGCNPNFEFGKDAKETPTRFDAGGGGGGHGDGSNGAGSLAQIEKTLVDRVAKDPKDVDSRKQLATLYAEQGLWDKATAVASEAIVIAPNDVALRVMRANVLLQRKDQGAAKADLEAASKIAPDDEEVLRAWGGYYLLTEDLTQAIKVRKRLLEKHPDVEDAETIELWNFYLARVPTLKEKNQTKEFFDLLSVGTRQQEQGKHAEAVETFTKAKAYMPDDPHLLASLAASQYESGARADAIVTWNQALAIDPKHGKARLGLARALAMGGDTKGAISTLKDWTKLDAKRAKRYDAPAIVARLEKGEPFDGASVAVGGGGGAHAITGTLALAPSVASKIQPGAVLYIMAKAQPGAGPPLAVVRAPVGKFPMTFTIDETNVMQQGMPFQDMDVHLIARIDMDGSAGAKPGDLEGTLAKPVAIGSKNVAITIDTVVGGGAAPAPTAAASSGPSISGTIALAPSLAKKVKPGSTLYIFAKMNPGGGPPMAVLREPVGTFPVSFTLDESNMMQPGMPFQGPLYVTARIDTDGIAGAGPGDLEGSTSSPVEIGTKGVAVTIDKER